MTTNFTGTILLTDDSGGTFRFNGGGSSSSQQQSSGSATATFDLGNSSVTLLNRNGGGDAYGTYYLGALAGGSSTFVKGAANGSSPSTYQIGDKNLSTVFAGTIANNTGPVGIIKTGTGTLTLSGQNTYTLNTVISNGVLALATDPNTFVDGAIDGSSVISVLANGVLDVSGRSDGALQLGYSQTLQGQGVVRGGLTAFGTVAPGDSANIGTLTVTNAINLYGTTWMKLNRASTPNSDRLVSSLSSIMYGGALVVTNAGATLQVGDTFTLFSGSGLNSGAFSPITLPSQYTWDTSNLGVNGTIKVTGVTAPPSISTVDFSTLASGYITLNAINGTPNGQVNVLTSTNLAAPLSSWTLVAGGAFDNSGNFSTTVNVDPAAPQSFFTLQAN
jgi:autotransporter-associated beta strand protein